MTPLCVLHHQLCVTRCSLGPNALNIAHFDPSVYISKLICWPCDDNLTRLHDGNKRSRGAGVPRAARLFGLCSAPKSCTMLIPVIHVFNKDDRLGDPTVHHHRVIKKETLRTRDQMKANKKIY